MKARGGLGEYTLESMYFLTPPVALRSAVIASERVVEASSRCQVSLEPSEAESFWREAVDELRTILRHTAHPDVDCGRVQVRTDGARTLIVFTTRDGRIAKRAVRKPSELLAVVEALQATIPEPEAQEPADARAALAPASPPADHSAPASPPPAKEMARARFLIDGSGGVRLGGSGGGTRRAPPSTLGSVSLSLGVGINVGSWDVGVFGQYDPAYGALSGDAAPDFVMSTYGLGLRAGRRDPLGPVDGVAGVMASIVLTDESNQERAGRQDGPQQQNSPTLSEARVGVFVGVVAPRRWPVRVRPELTFDIVPQRAGKTASKDNDPTLPALPWWSTSASLGIEWEAP